MSVNTVRAIRDMTLFRVIVFLGWTPRELERDSIERLESLRSTLHSFDWIPEGTAFPTLDLIMQADLDLWRPDERQICQVDGRARSRISFARSSYEEVIVFVGLCVEGPNTESGSEAWIKSSMNTWEDEVGPRDWLERVIPPDDPRSGNRGLPEVVGEAWVWTGEWDAPPEESWEVYGQKRYGAGRFSLPAWGLVGYTPGTDVEPPRFDLHATDAKGRNRALAHRFPSLLSHVLKVNHGHRKAYDGWLRPALDKSDREILDHCKPSRFLGVQRTIQELDKSVRSLSTALYHLDRHLVELEHRKLAIEVVLANLADSTWDDLAPTDLARGAKRFQTQLELDLKNYRATAEVGRNALGTVRTLVEIAETRNEQLLTLLGLFFGVWLGLGQLLGDTSSFDLSLIGTKLFYSVVPAIILVLIFRWWTRRPASH
ncbi:hypothetical protein [Singulisphaera sp. PoT]|uniref:hypothetical protein n=1 Tax=Singulisphaera sp. PoT TaxID=3411797 RepID=UPI003BF5D3C7